MGRYGAWRTALLTGILVVLTTLGLPLVAAAQRPGQVPRIAFLGLNLGVLGDSYGPQVSALY